MQLYQFLISRDLLQPQQAIEPTYSVSATKKEESEEKGQIEKVATTSKRTSKRTEKGNLLKISTEGKNLVSQTRFVPVKRNKIKRRNGNVKSAVNAFNKSVDSNPTRIVEYFKEENEKSKEHGKALMQMQCNMQLQMMQIFSQSHGSN